MKEPLIYRIPQTEWTALKSDSFVCASETTGGIEDIDYENFTW